jgi:hypothetical protein
LPPGVPVNSSRDVTGTVERISTRLASFLRSADFQSAWPSETSDAGEKPAESQRSGRQSSGKAHFAERAFLVGNFLRLVFAMSRS